MLLEIMKNITDDSTSDNFAHLMKTQSLIASPELTIEFTLDSTTCKHAANLS